MFNLFSSKKRIGLSFIEAYASKNGYGQAYIKNRKINRIKDYLEELRKISPSERSKRFLNCEAYWKGKYYPIIDCDGANDSAKASLFLNSQGIEYSLINTTSRDRDNFRYILEIPCNSAREAHRISSTVPGQCEQYLRTCDSRLLCRMEYKRDFQDPILLKEGPGESFNFLKEFLKTWEENRKLLEEVYFLKSLASESSLGSFSCSFDGDIRQSSTESLNLEIELGDLVSFKRDERLNLLAKKYEHFIKGTGYLYRKIEIGGIKIGFVADKRDLEIDEERPRHVVLWDHIGKVEKVPTEELVTSQSGELRRLGILRK